MNKPTEPRVRLFAPGTIIPFILLTSLFFAWGLANNMTDTLLAAFKRIMSMSDFQTSWIQLSFYGAYFFLALPAALLIRRFSYKTGVLLGLALFIGGALLFYPASITQVYSHFLIALFVLAGGLSILETSANPYIFVLGAPETGTRRLNFAQSFNPIGSLTGVLLSKVFILSKLNQAGVDERALMDDSQLNAIQQQELSAVMGPYVGVAFVLVVIGVLIALVKMPKASDAEERKPLGQTFRRLIRKPRYLAGVVAQFFYVGAQIGVWSFTIRYVMLELQINESHASEFYMAALILFTLSRFGFTALMKFYKPSNLLAISAVLAMISTLVVIWGNGVWAVYALVAISGFMSLMFPTIYGLSVAGLGEDTKVGGSGLIMAILGGALLTAAQGGISDATQSIHMSFWIPFVCFAVVAAYGFWVLKLKE